MVFFAYIKFGCSAFADFGFMNSPTFNQSLLVSFQFSRSFSLSNHYKAGGVAGTAVDLLFYPIDTIKTRLRASQGFLKAGGLRGVYKGVGSVIIGSGPGG